MVIFHSYVTVYQRVIDNYQNISIEFVARYSKDLGKIWKMCIPSAAAIFQKLIVTYPQVPFLGTQTWLAKDFLEHREHLTMSLRSWELRGQWCRGTYHHFTSENPPLSAMIFPWFSQHFPARTAATPQPALAPLVSKEGHLNRHWSPTAPTDVGRQRAEAFGHGNLFGGGIMEYIFGCMCNYFILYIYIHNFYTHIYIYIHNFYTYVK